MIGFSIMMWFISLILLVVSISLLRGNYSSMNGKSGQPVLFMAIGIAISGAVAIVTSEIMIPIAIIVCVAIIMGIWFAIIQKRFL